jgi:hypothetical protein
VPGRTHKKMEASTVNSAEHVFWISSLIWILLKVLSQRPWRLYTYMQGLPINRNSLSHMPGGTTGPPTCHRGRQAEGRPIFFWPPNHFQPHETI